MDAEVHWQGATRSVTLRFLHHFVPSSDCLFLAASLSTLFKGFEAKTHHSGARNLEGKKRCFSRETAINIVIGCKFCGLQTQVERLRTDISFKSALHPHTSQLSTFNGPLPLYGSVPAKPINPRLTLFPLLVSGSLQPRCRIRFHRASILALFLSLTKSNNFALPPDTSLSIPQCRSALISSAACSLTLPLLRSTAEKAKPQCSSTCGGGLDKRERRGEISGGYVKEKRPRTTNIRRGIDL